MLIVDLEQLESEEAGRVSLYGGAPFTGFVREVLPDGSREEVPMVGGREEGLLRRWTATGILISETSVLGDRRHGPSTEWYESGNRVRRRAWYEFGVCVSSTDFDDV